MELLFLGRGAAFNTKEGNNSAYFIEKNQLFIIDCGTNIYERIDKEQLLENVACVNIMITHTHDDHCGSIGSLIGGCYYKHNIPVNIILPSDIIYHERINALLTIFQVKKEMYKCVEDREYDNKFDTFENIRYVKTNHCDGYPSHGILFNTKDGLVYFSGDTNDAKLIQELISKYNNIDKLYIDTTNQDYPGNVHMYLGVLNKIIPNEYKSKVYCMHFNNDKCIEDAKKDGYNVVKVKTKKVN